MMTTYVINLDLGIGLLFKYVLFTWKQKLRLLGHNETNLLKLSILNAYFILVLINI